MLQERESHHKVTMDEEQLPKTIETSGVVDELTRVEESLKTLHDQLREKNEEINKLKQAVLIATGAKVTLGKLLGVNK